MRRITKGNSEFLRLCRVVELLRATGVSEEVIMSLLTEKLRTDAAHEESRLRIPDPSVN